MIIVKLTLGFEFSFFLQKTNYHHITDHYWRLPYSYDFKIWYVLGKEFGQTMKSISCEKMSIFEGYLEPEWAIFHVILTFDRWYFWKKWKGNNEVNNRYFQNLLRRATFLPGIELYLRVTLQLSNRTYQLNFWVKHRMNEGRENTTLGNQEEDLAFDK